MSVDSVFIAPAKRRTDRRAVAQSAVLAQPPALDMHCVAFLRGTFERHLA